jgi:hypothetical protein
MDRYSVALKKKSRKKTTESEKTLEKVVKKTADSYRQLRKDIELIVNSHSGGLKLMELIPELITKRKNPRINIETIMGVIHSSETLRVLEYTWKANNRTKIFVYTP